MCTVSAELFTKVWHMRRNQFSSFISVDDSMYFNMEVGGRGGR
jgi:hypothetical protein